MGICSQLTQRSMKGAKERGVTNILALRGGEFLHNARVRGYHLTASDPPRGEEDWIPTDPRFVHGADLVRYIRSLPEYADFSIAVAGYI